MNKKRLKQLFLLFLLAGIFYACLQSELFEVQEPLNLPPELAAAKQWYETEIGGSNLHWRVGGRSSILEADWQNAFAGNHTDFQIIEVPLKSETPFYRMISDVAERARSTGDERYMVSATRLLIRTCHETNKKDAFVMVVSPDLEYLSRNLDNPLRNFTYINRGKEFSGLVFFYDLAGELASGFHITGGEAFRFFTEESMANQPQLRAAGICSFLCTTTAHYQFVFANGTMTRQYLGSTEECVLLTCWATSEETGGGGGGGGGPAPPGTGEQRPQIPLERIFNRPNNMTDAEWRTVERLFNQVQNNCVGEALMNTMMGLLSGSQRLNIQFDDEGGNRFRMQGGTVFLRTDATPDTFFHELFHARQAFRETPETWGTVEKNPLLNLEMEARYAQYLFARQMPGFEDSALHRRWENDPSRRTVMELTDYLSSHGNLLPGAAADLDTHIRTSIMPALGAVRGHAQLMFDDSRVGIANFNSIRSLTINCP
jgi:hypothetical protein